ncbi:HAD family hydrolase [Ornithinimicrobium pekingense]|uniref:Haloacid dehalogenase n=1 Tax=Ornithinimicrobium pekingense TaxID=384677 RepID=A0ABQ2F657_9MICO|nr:HAD-IA family hydrolase [Ornithinimicrobium pekingense]GGK57528.1 haloacid dehalogenase [Ornithinimicrobium pekingense]
MSGRERPWAAVLFDFDGTLADTVPLIVESFRHTLAETDGDLEEHEIRGWIGRILHDVLEERHPGRGEELVRRYREHNLTHHDTLIRRVHGAAELLADLHAHGIPVAVVSSKSHVTVRRGMRVTGLPEVEHVVGLEDTTAHKPDPAPLLEGARRLAVDPAASVYVGDALVDVLAARAAGMGSVAVTWGAGTRDVLQRADHVVDDVAQLRDVLLPGAPRGRRAGGPSPTT